MAKSYADAVADLLNKKFAKDAGTEIASRGNDELDSDLDEVLPTGIEVLDRYLFGVGGLPTGRMAEIFGEEASCKTTLMYQWIATTQAQGGHAVCLDMERSFDKARAACFGVDVANLAVATPRDLEMVMDVLHAVLDAHDPSRGKLGIWWDSVAAAAPNDELEGNAGDQAVGAVPRLLSKEFRKIQPKLKPKRAALVMLNQTRQRIGVRFGDPTTTPGGNPMRFYPSFRASSSPGSKVEVNGRTVGKDVLFTVKKTRFTEPFRQARVRLLYEGKFDMDWSTLELAKTLVEGFEARDAAGKVLRGPAAVQAARKALGWP